MAITEEMISNASEWGIRSLVSSSQFPIEGDLSEILSAQDMEYRMSDGMDNIFTKHPIIGEHLDGQRARVKMSVCDMVSRQQADLELVGDALEMSYDWLQIPSDYDKLIIVRIIRKFLDYQVRVHNYNMSSPSDAEVSDYRVLKQLHNYLIDSAEDWLNRKKYTVKDAPTGDMADILNSGPSTVIFGEKTSKREIIVKYDIGGFSGLSEAATTWGDGIL